MLDLLRLRVLRAVVAEGSVTGAASTLGYSPSSVSQHVTALARSTGVALLERRGRGVLPTPAARRLAGGADRVFEALADLEALAADLRAGRTGTLAVTTFASAGATWIPPIVATLSRELPDLRIDLRLQELAGPDARPPDVELFVVQPGAADPPATRSWLLLEEPYLAVVGAGHRLAGRPAVALRDLDGEAWVDNDVARGACRQVVLDACAAAGFAPAFRVEAQDYPTAMAVVAAGLGVTVLPRLALVALPAGACAVPLVDPTPTRRIGLRVRDDAATSPAVLRLVELLEARVAATAAA